MIILFDFAMYGEFADGYEIEVGGRDEEDCMYKLIDIQDKGTHGELVFYTCINNEYYFDGYLKEEYR